MIRADMISTVGRAYLTSNIENDEYSYPKAFSAASLTFAPIQNSAGRRFEKLDIRFVKDNISVLIETKQNFTAADEEQLSAYVEYEKALTGNKIIAILAERIYTFRCAIAHSKGDIDGFIAIPSVSDKEVLKEIELIKYLSYETLRSCSEV